MTKKTFSVIKNYFFQFSKQGFDSSEIVIFVTRIISCFYKFDYSHSMLWGGLIPFFQPAFESNPFFPCKFKLDMWCISWMEGMKISIANTGLTLFCIMLKNGQTYFKTFEMFTPQDFQSMFGHLSTLNMTGLTQISLWRLIFLP